MIKLALSLAAAIASTGAGPRTAADTLDQPTRTAIAQIDSDMQAAAAKGFGGALIIHRGRSVLLSKGYGFADRARHIPFTPDTVAQIGSLTKSQTGAALATLIAQGKVALSDPVAKFVPEAPEPGRSRTIAQLVSHSSGLMSSCTNDFDRQSETMLVKTCLAKPLAHAPGEDHYSNMGYSVLALVIQRVTGKRWEDAVRERVWQPLGMRAVGFSFPGRIGAQFAHGYLNGVEQPLISSSIAGLRGDDWALRGNGGVQASSSAMMRFLDGILDPGSGLSPAARKLILSPVPGQSAEAGEGFGIVFKLDPAGQIVRMGHSGSDGTFFSYIGWVRANDLRVYFVGNSGEDQVKPVLQQVLRIARDLPPASSPGQRQ